VPKTNAPLDVKRQLRAKNRLEQNQIDRHIASREQATAEHGVASATARVARAAEQRAEVPPGLQAEQTAIWKETEPGRREPGGAVAAEDRMERRLELLKELRASRTNLSPDERVWLDQQVELLEARADLTASKAAAERQSENVQVATDVEPDRRAGLARAGQSLADLIRSDGPNYRALGRSVNYDEVMDKAIWEQRKANRPKGAPPLLLDTDHIVPVREIRDLVIESGLLEIYEKAPPSVRAQIERAIQDLGDERANLVRMERYANQTWKSDRPWSDIRYEQVKSLYSTEMVNGMRTRATAQRAHYVEEIRKLVRTFNR
jgi:hypothetical protein